MLTAESTSVTLKLKVTEVQALTFILIVFTLILLIHFCLTISTAPESKAGCKQQTSISILLDIDEVILLKNTIFHIKNNGQKYVKMLC